MGIDMSRDIIIESVFIGHAVGTIFQGAPYHKPRKIEKIVDDIHNYFVKHGIKCMDSYLFDVDTNDRYELVKKIMMSSQSFVDLNLSQDEFDRGVKVDDEGRSSFGFCGRDFKLKDYYDFIDLDACIRNIDKSLYWHWVDNEIFEERLELCNVPIKKAD